MYQRLAILMKAGVAPAESFTLLADERKSRIGRRLSTLADDIRRGAALELAFRESRLFPPLHCAIIAVGETTGRLDTSFQWLADHVERELSLRRRLEGELWHSKLTLCAALVAAYFLMPRVLSTGVIVFAFLLLGFGGVLLIQLIVTRTEGLSHPRVDRFVSRVPLVGSVAAATAQGRFARAFAALYAAGVEVSPALRSAAAASGSGVLADRVLQALPAVERGEGITRALTETNALPKAMLGLLNTGESTGNVDTLMEWAARDFEEDATARLHQLFVILGVLALLIVGGIVLLTLIALYNQALMR